MSLRIVAKLLWTFVLVFLLVALSQSTTSFIYRAF